MSESQQGKPRPYQAGANCNFWRGGVTAINKAIRSSLEYQTWRRAIFERDNYACTSCGARNGNGRNVELHADHIKPFSLYPELRFDLTNGRTLCLDCHRKTDTYALNTKYQRRTA